MWRVIEPSNGRGGQTNPTPLIASGLISVASATHTKGTNGLQAIMVVMSGAALYSLRSATTGSTRDARRAGTRHARVATPSRMNETTVAVEM